MSRPSSFIPMISWLRSYGVNDLRGDLLAGLTVGVMLIPQSMAYALLAGVPPIYGLYASAVPLLVYTVLGTSRHLAVGIMAIDSLIVFAALSPLAEPMSAEYIGLALLMAFMAGAIQIAMGLARFGFVVALLSRPVITGFTAAAAVTIGFSQLQSLVGIPLPRTPNIFVLMAETAANLADVHLATFAIGVGAILLLVALRRWMPVAPGPLVAVILGTLLVWQLRLDTAGVAIVGTIPTGLPSPLLPAIDLGSVQTLLPAAATLGLLQFMTVISLVKVFDGRRGLPVDANRELIALGGMNLAGSLFRSIPVSGSFSRTAVNDLAGGRTPFSNGIAALLIGLTLLFLTPLFFYLPIPVFAAIIMVAAFGMLDIREVRFLLRSKRIDGWIAVFTFLATLVFGIQNGLLIGITASVVAILIRIGRPHIAELGHVPGTQSFSDLARTAKAQRIDGLYIVRVDASFGFANADFVRNRILVHCNADPDIRAVLIDASPVNDLDTTAAGVLEQLVDTLSGRGITVCFAGVKGRVRDVIVESGLEEAVGSEHFFLSLHAAVREVLESRIQVDAYVRSARERWNEDPDADDRAEADFPESEAEDPGIQSA